VTIRHAGPQLSLEAATSEGVVVRHATTMHTSRLEVTSNHAERRRAICRRIGRVATAPFRLACRGCSSP
jgi:hypothetical protein